MRLRCRWPRPRRFALRRRWGRGTEMRASIALPVILRHRILLGRWLQASALALALVGFMGAGDDSARFKDLGHRMMCVCGCGQVLLECNHVGCTYSDKMRDQLQAALDKGNTNND